jgi:hypothetical protein
MTPARRNPDAALRALQAALTSAGYNVRQDHIARIDALVARRADWKTLWVHLHTFVIVLTQDALTAERAEQLAAAAQQYAIDHKGGLPRGLQTGTVTVAVFLTKPSQALEKWFSADPQHRYAALRFPILADVSTGALTYFKGRMSRGYLYGADLRTLAETIVARALRADP